MDNSEPHREQAYQAAERARRLLAQPATLDSYDWLLVAGLLVQADNALRLAQEDDPSFKLPVLDEVVEELREVTSNFTRPEFVHAAKAARRQNPALFAPRR